MSRAGLFLLVLGLLQMAGAGLDSPALRGIGAAMQVSPAPKVFSAVRGYETYSTRFFIAWDDDAGNPHEVLLTPEIYARIAGPYNRRNAYGAALAYGPVLPPSLRDPVVHFALCGTRPLLKELGIDPGPTARRLRVRYQPRPGVPAPDVPLTIEALCDRR